MSTHAARSSIVGSIVHFFVCAVSAVVLTGLGLTLVALAAFSIVKGTDVIYATGYTVTHWSDEQAFPKGAEFCKGLYCRRTDTTRKHVAGSEHHQSGTSAHFCPEHHRSDYLVFLDLSHLGTMSWYFYGACVLFAVTCWYSLAAAAVSGLIAGPALLLARRPQARTTINGLWLSTSVLVGLLLATPSCILYVWW